jgi:ABC-type glycerol-3-phosphate transport system substrate-binding protein
MNKKYLIFGGAAIALIIIVVAGILIFGRNKTTTNPTPTPVDCTKDPTNSACNNVPQPNQQANITMWGVFDDGSIYQPLIAEFNKQYPNIKVTYVKKSYADYESTLVDAIASNEGPDIFNVSNFWLPKHKSKMAPAPTETLSADEFNQSFIQSAYDDFVSDGKVYGVTLYTDNLVLLYNKKLLNNDNLYEPPLNWTDVTSFSKILTKKAPGNPNEITQAGIALGTSGTVIRSADILTALMLQTGTPIISDDKRSFNFNQFRKDAAGQTEYPGTSALKFYTSFADPQNAFYSWNDSFGSSIQAFAQGKVAMIVGYSYFIPQIEKINPALSYGISNLPQIKGAPENIDFVNYWGWSVSNRSKNSGAAWLFLKFLSQKDQMNNYLQATARTSPLKNNKGASNSIFDNQKYYSKTIFKANGEEYDTIFSGMIDDVIKYKQPPQSAIDAAQSKANEMLSKYY